MGKKGTWFQAIMALAVPVLIVFTLRWALFEPFLIPSGSMLPNLLIHDHILVKKFDLGLKVPFVQKWLIRWKEPKRGEIMVFHYPLDPKIFYIKRLIGIPGDHVQIQDGKIVVNEQEWELEEIFPTDAEEGFQYFIENSGEEAHVVRFSTEFTNAGSQDVTLGPGQYFLMGDNRDQSSDSRFWGVVDEKLLIGPAKVVWLSCVNTLANLPYICDPAQIRWQRLGQVLTPQASPQK